ncbi:MAG: WG repeat-containing protein [Flammeovirgaceae bacterium]
MKVTQLLFTAFLFIHFSFVNGQHLLPIKQAGKWGAINESGKMIIKPQYDFIGEFKEVQFASNQKSQWATFRKAGNVGIIDQQAKVILETDYQQVKIFQNMTAAVWKNGQCGLMDETGKLVVAPEYDNIDQLTAHLYKMVFKQKIGISDRKGNVLHAAVFDRVEAFQNGFDITLVEQGAKFGVLDRSGKLLLPTEYDKIALDQYQLKAFKGKTITFITLGADAEVKSQQTYTNQTALDLAQKKAALATKRQELANNPQANKPQWIKEGFRYKLVDFFGKNLLRKEFFSVNVDEETQLSLGILENDQKELECYLIDHQKANILMKTKAKDLVLSDFRTSNYARLSIDTLWDGLINKSGEIIQQINGQKITNIGNYNEQRAYVHIGSKFGFIDENAQLVIPLAYDIVSEFKEGYAIAKKDGKFGCLKPDGTVALPISFDGIGQPRQGVVRVKKGRGRTGKWALYTLNNTALTEFIYDTIDEFENGEAIMRRAGKWGVINTQGKEVVTASITCSRLFPFKNGIAQIGNELIVENIAGAPKRRYKLNGYVNRAGEEIVPPNYDYIFDFDSIWQAKSGLARVVKGKFVGYLNAQGEEVVTPKYAGIQGFEDAWKAKKGLAKIISPDGKFGYINHYGKLVLNPAFSSVENFEAVLADTNQWARASDSGKFGYINYKGETKISFIYERISEFKAGAAIVKKEGKYGLISKENKLLIPIEYDGIRYLPGSNKTLLKVYKKNPSVYELDGNGAIVKKYPFEDEAKTSTSGTKLPKYKYLTEFDQNGLAIIQLNKLKGMANAQGKIIIKPKYQQLGTFHEGLAYFQAANKDRSKRKWGYLNQQGKEVIPATFSKATDFNEGKAAVFKRLWGYINQQGQLIIPHKYKNALAFSDGKAVVDEQIIINEKGAQLGKITLEGQVSKGFQSNRAILQSKSGSLHITPEGLPAYYTKYDEVTNFIGGIAFVKRGEVWELTRKMNENQSKVRFTSAQRNAYLATYGKRYKRKTPFGTLQDVKWEKVNDGLWRMIDSNGNFINESIYDQVLADEGAVFKVRKDGFFGIANLQGTFISKAENDIIKVVTDEVIRIEHEGKIGYLKPDGTWIWELQ